MGKRLTKADYQRVAWMLERLAFLMYGKGDHIVGVRTDRTIFEKYRRGDVVKMAAHFQEKAE